MHKTTLSLADGLRRQGEMTLELMTTPQARTPGRNRKKTPARTPEPGRKKAPAPPSLQPLYSSPWAPGEEEESSSSPGTQQDPPGEHRTPNKRPTPDPASIVPPGGVANTPSGSDDESFYPEGVAEALVVGTRGYHAGSAGQVEDLPPIMRGGAVPASSFGAAGVHFAPSVAGQRTTALFCPQLPLLWDAGAAAVQLQALMCAAVQLTTSAGTVGAPPPSAVEPGQPCVLPSDHVHHQATPASQSNRPSCSLLTPTTNDAYAAAVQQALHVAEHLARNPGCAMPMPPVPTAAPPNYGAALLDAHASILDTAERAVEHLHRAAAPAHQQPPSSVGVFPPTANAGGASASLHQTHTQLSADAAPFFPADGPRRGAEGFPADGPRRGAEGFPTTQECCWTWAAVSPANAASPANPVPDHAAPGPTAAASGTGFVGGWEAQLYVPFPQEGCGGAPANGGAGGVGSHTSGCLVAMPMPVVDQVLANYVCSSADAGSEQASCWTWAVVSPASAAGNPAGSPPTTAHAPAVQLYAPFQGSC